MATKKSSNSKTKTIKNNNDEKIVKVNIQEEETLNESKASKDPIDLDKIYDLIGSLQAEIHNLQEENKALKQEAENFFVASTENENFEEDTADSNDVYGGRILDMDDPNRKITVYHTQEMSHNLSTYIKLSTTKRNLRRAGEVVRFSLNDFEELVGEYRRFFEKGILAVSIRDADFADLYSLPIWDEKNKSVYTSKILKEVSSYDVNQLRDFYNNLSEDNKHSFLCFWLGKVYSKEKGFYDVEKIGWLKNIANTNLFDAIILEMNTNIARGGENIVLDANKMI